MVKSCLVATCKNTILKSGITFHKIGKKQYVNRLKAIGRSADECLSSQNVICSEHYSEDDFIYFNGKKYLRVEAMPRFLIPRKPEKPNEIPPNEIPPNEIPPNEITPNEIPPPSTSDLPTNSTDANALNAEVADDIWLMCTDILILISKDNQIDATANQEILPLNEFLSSSSMPTPEDCETFEFNIDQLDL